MHCSNCGRAICPDCMTPTPVGMRCPECSRDRTKVRTLRSTTSEPVVTYALIAINVIAFLAEGRLGSFGSSAGGSTLYDKGVLYGPFVANGDWWRIVTSGFLHANLLHIGFNMYLLYLLGNMVEPAIGSLRFGLAYLVSLLAGSFGVLLISPNSAAVGASGAVFGLMGLAAVELRSRGINPFETGIGGLIVLNLVFSFVFPGIAIGAHIGGLIGGAMIGLLFATADRRRIPGSAALAAGVVLAGAAAVGAVTVA